MTLFSKIKISVLALVLFSVCTVVRADDGDIFVEYPSENLMRKIQTNGFIYEYFDEAEYSNEWSTWGRSILAYEEIDGEWQYKTWDWETFAGDGQVFLTEYVGDYVLEANTSAALSGVSTSERRISYLYDHKDNWGVDTADNGWIEREKTIYDTDGEKVLEKYLRNANDLLVKDIHTDTNVYYVYEYHDVAGMEEVIHYKKKYVYDEADEADILSGNAGIFVDSLEYIDTDYTVRWGANGKITTLHVDGDNSYNNTYLDPSDGIFHIYNWNDSWELISVRKEHPDGTVEICIPDDPEDTVWPLLKKRVPSDGFIKGVNLPWIHYGYDMGMRTETGDYDGYSKNLNELYGKMDKHKGDCVRLFLFADLRVGVDFDASGNPVKFTDRVYEDMNALLDCASALGIKLIPVLFDYMIADGVSGPGFGEHPDVITDPAKRGLLVNLFKEFIQEFGDHESIYAWDIMNEPECSNINIADLQNFVTAFTTMIHTETSKAKVTVGSLDKESMQDHWIDVGLDIYQFHYYDKMGSPEEYLTSIQDLGKPVIAGEIGATNVADKLSVLRQNGYDGGLFWQDEQAGDEFTISEEEYEVIDNWFYGTTYTYYEFDDLDVQCLESKTTSAADEYGNVYYHYIEEKFYDNGTANDDSDDYGRVDVQVLATKDKDGAIAYENEHFAGTATVSTKRCYEIANYEDPAAPIVETLVVTYTYYETGCLKSRILPTADKDGNMYYHYKNEKFFDNDTPDNDTDDYGRVDVQVLAEEDSDGAIAYVNEYFAGIDKVSTKKCYETADYTDPAAATVETLLVTYTYYEDTGNMHLKTEEGG
ncbi:MAG: hypothetical protein ISS33_00560, partial [Candidatus Omnitrophica bacterium]|nr:hypothetical protein [Candidatus Omnitrophota bacterium]